MSCSTLRKTVGHISGDQYNLNKNVADSIKVSWNQYLKTNNIAEGLKDIKIIKDHDIVTKNEYYAIFATASNDSAHVATRVILEKGNFTFPGDNVNRVTICYGSINCLPKLYNNNWACDNGTEQWEVCFKDCSKIGIVVVKEKKTTR